MNPQTLAVLDADFRKYPMLVAGSVPAHEIAEMEEAIGFALPDDYKFFVERFGGAIVGPFSIFGLRASEAMAESDSSAVEVTKRFRQHRWPGTEGWLIVSMDHAGNPFGLDSQGHVFISDHDAGFVEKIADSFEGFLRSRCLKLS